MGGRNGLVTRTAATVALLALIVGLAPVARADGPPSFIPAGETPSEPDAWFIRVKSLKIGGEFDSMADEEVHVFLTVGGKTLEVVATSLDMPSNALAEFDLDDSAFVELVPAETFGVDIEVKEADVTAWEYITGTSAPYRLIPSDFGEEGGEKAVEIGTETIRLQEGSFFSGKTEVKLRGANVTVGLVRAKRRTGPDESSRKRVKEVFADALRPTAVTGPALARHIAQRTAEAAGTSDRAARRSVNTYLRKRLPELARKTRTVAELASDAAAADPEIIAEKRKGLTAASRRLRDRFPVDAELEKILVTAERLAKQPPDPLDEDSADDLIMDVGMLVDDAETQLEDVRAAKREEVLGQEELDAMQGWVKAVRDLEGALGLATAGWAAWPEMESEWKALQEELAAECGEK